MARGKNSQAATARRAVALAEERASEAERAEKAAIDELQKLRDEFAEFKKSSSLKYNTLLETARAGSSDRLEDARAEIVRLEAKLASFGSNALEALKPHFDRLHLTMDEWNDVYRALRMHPGQFYQQTLEGKPRSVRRMTRRRANMINGLRDAAEKHGQA